MRYLIDRVLGMNSSNFSVKRKGKRTRLTALLVAVIFSAVPIGAEAATYNIGGPSSTHASLWALRTSGLLSAGDTVNLYNSTDSSLQSSFQITNASGGELTFTSPDGTVINPSVTTPNIRFLVISDTTNTAVVSAENITFTGFSEAYGAAIRADGRLNFGDNTTFTGNTATNNGGAIYIGQSGSIGDNNTFTGNRATGSYGGAIWTGNGLTTGTGNSFTNNTAGQHGGALWASSGDLIIGATNVFTNNEATASNANGGAIAAWTGNVTINNSTAGNITLFTGNQAGNIGGAVYASDKVAVGDYTTFHDNYAGSTAGAVYAVNGVTLGSNTAFTWNEAVSYGGAIVSVWGDVTSTAGATGQNFSNNIAGGVGGAIFTNASVSLGTNVTITGNKTTNGSGGAIYAGQSVTIADSTAANVAGITGNTATGHGGAIYAGTVATTGNYTTFTGNTAGAGGGAIYANTGSVTIGENNIFGGLNTGNGNTSGSHGGAIYAAGGSATIGDYTQFLNNSAGPGWANGGAIYANTTASIGNYTTFSGNSAGTHGGAVYALGNVDIGGNNLFTGNAAPSQGGAIYSHSGTVSVGNNNTFGGVTVGNTALFGGVIWASGDVTVGTTNTFQGNSAVFGGAIYSDTGKVTVGDGSNFINNAGGWAHGGAIYAKTDITIGKNNTFSGNTTGSDGAAIYSDTGNVEVGSGSQFLNNTTVGGHGGAISAIAGTVTILSNTGSAQTFTGNKAGFGGAIYASGDVIIEGNTIFGGINATNGNTAVAHGGAIYSDLGSVTTGAGTDFLNNKITGWGGGGAIYSATGVAIAAGNTFTGNSAVSYGGAVWANAGDVLIGSNTQFLNNAAGWGSGGAIYSAVGMVSGGDSLSFIGNTSGNQGGAIFAATGVTIGNDSTFNYNTASGWGGGAIFADTGNVFIGTGATFKGNSTVHAGGAINGYGNSPAKDGIVTVGANSTFGGYGLGEGNRAVDSGGAIYATTEATIGANATFIGNSSSAGHGGAIYVYGFEDAAETCLTFTGDVSFANNTAMKGQLQTDPWTYSYDWTYGSGGAVHVEFGDILFNGATTFDNNHAAMHGGAVANRYGDVTFGDNVRLTGNSVGVVGANNDPFTDSYGGNGGAIYANGNVIIGDNLVLSNNKTLYAPWQELPVPPGDKIQNWLLPMGNGGGIFTMNGAVIIGNEALMEGNIAARRGGAIYATVDDQNQWWNRDNLSVFIGDNLTARNNSSDTSYGGVIYTEFNATIGDNAKFENNEALNVPLNGDFAKGNPGRGGAIFSHRGNIVAGFGLDAAGGLVLYGNQAAGHGGAFTAWDQDTFEYHVANPNDPNYAYHFIDRGNITIGTNATIDSNRSLYASGGALHAQFGDVDIWDRATIINNSAGMTPGGPADWKNAGYGSGGAIYGLDIYIGKDTKVSNNEAMQRGGALYADMNVAVDAGTIFEDNIAHYAGGAIFSQSRGAWVHINGTVWRNADGSVTRDENNDIIVTMTEPTSDAERVIFRNNVARGDDLGTTNWGDGGAINVHDGSLMVVHTTFENNEALGSAGDAIGHGGAIHMGHGAYIDPITGELVPESTGWGWIGDGTRFITNTAASHGGAISAYGKGTTEYLLPVLLTVTGDNIWFEGNQAGTRGDTGLGGAIYGEGSGYVVIGGTNKTEDIVFTNNTATQSGGAISVDSDLFIGDGVVFTNNSAGILEYDVNGNITRTVRGRGGAIHMRNTIYGDVNVNELRMQVLSGSDSNFTGNTAVMLYSYIDINGREQLEYRKVYNDITLDGNTQAFMRVDEGGTLRFQGGVIIEHDPDHPIISHSADWTMWGGGEVILGGYFDYLDDLGRTITSNSRSYATGTTTLAQDTTLRLEYGAQIGIDRVGVSVAGQRGKHVGEFVSELNSTIAMEVDPTVAARERNNQYTQPITEIKVADGHSWVHGATIRIDDTTDFVLDGVVWQPKTVYNLAETTLLDASGNAIRLRDYAHLSPDAAYAAVKADAVKNVYVTTGLNRGLVEGETNDSFASGAQAIKYANNVGADVDGTYIWRDFVYYSGTGTPGADVNDSRILTDAHNNVVREYGGFNDLNVKGNIYAVELVRVNTGAPMYYDPSFLNRNLSNRLYRPLCCCCIECPAQCEDGCTVCDELTPHPVSVIGRVDYHNDWNFWGEGYGMGGNIRQSTIPGSTLYSNAGLMVGGDREELGEWIFGGYYSYGSSISQTNETFFGNVRSNTHYKGGEHRFGGYLRLDDRFGYTLANGFLGTNNYNYNRTLDVSTGVDRFYGKFNARTSGMYLERGADILANNRNTVTPFGALQYANLRSGNFVEQSDNAADMAQTMRFNYDSLRSILGIYSQSRLTTKLKWDNRIAWERELLSNTGVVKNAYLTQSPGTNFRIVGDYGGRDWYNFRTGLNWDLSMRLCVNFDYDLYFNKNGAFHAGMGGLTYRH